MEKENTNRRLELSVMFLEMGQALIKEGTERKDYCVSQSGNFMILMSGVIMGEEETYELGQLTSMFTAKKLLDGLEENKSDLTEYLKKKASGTSYDDIIKRINKLRGDNGEAPLA